MNISRRDLEALGFTVSAEGVVTRADGAEVPAAAQGTTPAHRRRKTETEKPRLARSMVEALVAAVPRPEVFFAGGPDVVIGADPSVDHTGLACVTRFPTPRGRPLSEQRFVYTARARPKRGAPLGERLSLIAETVCDFVEDFAPWEGVSVVAVVEGHYWRGSGDASPDAIATYSEAVGACFGVLRAAVRAKTPLRGEVVRVGPSWMPDTLVGKVKGGTQKADRHEVARALLARAGVTWPEGVTEDEQDAAAQCVALLVERGFL